MQRIAGNMNEVIARGGPVVLIADQEAADAMPACTKFVIAKLTSAYLQPLLANVVLQLLAYHVATIEGLNVDRPRSLAKAVTVE